MTGHFSDERFRAFPVVGILRGVDSADLVPLLGALEAGGLLNVEITMNTEGAIGQIREAVAGFGDRMNVGAGTVTGEETLESALAAGATFIVTPTVVDEVIGRCAALEVPVFPGACSPTEVLRARDGGARAVKLFPAEHLGPAHVRRIREVDPGVPLMPTGGVTPATLGAYVEAGAVAFGVGGTLFPRACVSACDWDGISAVVRAFRSALEAAFSRNVT